MNRQRMPADALSTASVLIIEDDPNLMGIVRNAIEPNYRITACLSAREALALLDNGERFDVMITALHLPDLSAPELLQRVGEADPVLARNSLLIAKRRLSIADEEFLDDSHVRAIFVPLRTERLCDEVDALAARAALAMFDLAEGGP
jgi:DNA-binding NtrC family response regulator